MSQQQYQGDVQMPLFGPASGSNAKITDWGDVDNLDIDALAEYFLEEANGAVNNVGMTFDFSLDHSKQTSGVVSPENSEDGILPPVGDCSTSTDQQATIVTAQQPQQQVLPVPQPMPQPVPQPAILQGAPVPLAPPVLMQQGGAIVTPQIANLLAFQMQQQQQQQQAMVENMANKRQRLSPAAPNMAAAANQNLAVTAAQALEQHSRGRGRKSQAQIDRRRERNRILARRTRLRKKFFFESLQKDVLELQQENARLKKVVKTQLGTDGEAILASCEAIEKLPPGVLEACGAKSEFSSQDFSLIQSIRGSQHSFVITDPSLADNPIVFASDDFLSITGYTREQVLGRNCRFLQGTDTRKESIEAIRNALSKGEDVSVTVVNYTSDGTPFWNKLFIAALRDAQNSVVNFIGVTVCVATPEPDHPDHGKVFTKANPDKPENSMKVLEDSIPESLFNDAP